jgi:hypothetical protein
VNMLLLSPAGHAHYLLLLLPLFMGLLAAAWERRGSPRVPAWFTALLLLNAAASGLPLLLRKNVLQHLGVAMYAALAVWLAGVVTLARLTRAERAAGGGPAVTVPAAA